MFNSKADVHAASQTNKWSFCGRLLGLTDTREGPKPDTVSPEYVALVQLNVKCLMWLVQEMPGKDFGVADEEVKSR